MSLKEKYEFIGKEARVQLGGLSVLVTILDYKNSYGHDRWLVSPVAGDGKVWVEDVAV